MPGFEVHPANGEGGGVDAGREVVQVIEDTSCYWLRRNVKHFFLSCACQFSLIRTGGASAPETV